MQTNAFLEVDTPALLLDLDQVERNIARYQAAASAAGIRLRPHAKAHKCPEVGRLQVAAGAAGLCCAKLGEAEVMHQAGLRDLLITTPVIGASKIRRLMALARTGHVAVVADDEAAVAALADAARSAAVKLDVLVEIDVGQARAGVPPGPAAAQLAHVIAKSPGLRFAGIQAYQGRLQGIPSLEERRARVLEAMAGLHESRRLVREAGLECPVATGGGSGSFPIDLALHALDELQPGSYVTMDTAYGKVDLGTALGEHALGQPLSVLASVISRPTADRAVVDVGWKSASNDGGTPAVKGRPDLAFEFAGDEHGILRSSAGRLDLALGERIELVPSHCDTTVNLHDTFVVHRSGVVQGTWAIAARGRSQ
jgi:D-serine deaminase-like pyridoxal phosphate-dependent protein